MDHDPAQDLIPKTRSTRFQFEGEDYRTPVAFEGEDFRKPVAFEGEDFRKPVAFEGEDFRKPVGYEWDGNQAAVGAVIERNGRLISKTLRPDEKAPLRLIHVGPCFMNGGVEQHTMSLAKFLNPQRVHFVKCLVTNPDHLCPQAITAMSVPVEFCDPSEIHHAASECDVMLLWGDGYNKFLEPARPPLCIFVAHGESCWTAQTLENSARVIDHAIAVSPRVKERACRTIPSTMIMNGVDLAHLGHTHSRAAGREKLGFAPHDFVLGSVGRFSEEKRMPLLIEAVAQLPRQFKLLLVGHGARGDELLRQANELIPGRFAFASASDYLGDYYRAMDAFSLVSEHEGFGLVLAEAMFCERPVIATNVGFVPEVIRDRINGLIVEPTPDSIAAAVRLLQEHPDWARGLAAEGRAAADARFHATRMASEYENLLWKLWRAKALSKTKEAL
ncbi:MAG: glycosyltransferase family 4 protein [Planctomycetota bacterium]